MNFIFLCMAKIFAVKFQNYILKFQMWHIVSTCKNVVHSDLRITAPLDQRPRMRFWNAPTNREICDIHLLRCYREIYQLFYYI